MMHTFYLWYYGKHMVKDYSESERGNLLLGYSFWSSTRFLLCAPSHSKIAHTTTLGTPDIELWLECEIAQQVHYEGLIW